MATGRRSDQRATGGQSAVLKQRTLQAIDDNGIYYDMWLSYLNQVDDEESTKVMREVYDMFRTKHHDLLRNIAAYSSFNSISKETKDFLELNKRFILAYLEKIDQRDKYINYYLKESEKVIILILNRGFESMFDRLAVVNIISFTIDWLKGEGYDVKEGN